MQLEGHGDGDFGLMNSFLSLLEKKRSNPDAKISSLGKTNAFESLESHLIAFAAEKSRLTDKTIIMNEFKKKNGL
jgi:hypothetical protein